jgi:hypothetical protein
MPSQRLLKMLDPRGHMGHRVLETRTAVVVCFVSAPMRDWVAREATAAGATPLLATSFRHVATSLHPSALPQANIALLDFDILGAGDISQLITLRWTGYRGRVIAMSRSGVIDPRTVQLASIDAMVRPNGVELRTLLAR